MKGKIDISKIIKNLKFRKISIDDNKWIVDLLYVKNDFYYSIIYHPKVIRRESIKYSFSLSPERLSSFFMKEFGVTQNPISSLQVDREKNKIVQNREGNPISDNEVFNKSEFKKKTNRG